MNQKLIKFLVLSIILQFVKIVSCLEKEMTIIVDAGRRECFFEEVRCFCQAFENFYNWLLTEIVNKPKFWNLMGIQCNKFCRLILVLKFKNADQNQQFQDRKLICIYVNFKKNNLNFRSVESRLKFTIFIHFQAEKGKTIDLEYQVIDGGHGDLDIR